VVSEGEAYSVQKGSVDVEFLAQLVEIAVSAGPAPDPGSADRGGRPYAPYIGSDVTKVSVTHILSGQFQKWTTAGEQLDVLREWANSLKYEPYADGRSPGDADGGEMYEFVLTEGDYPGFTYVISGPDHGYLLIEDEWFTVSDPSVPPAVCPAESHSDPSLELPLQEPALDEFVSVEVWIPDIRTELCYATENNFTGQTIYSFDKAWLRFGTVQKLTKAQEMFAERGYSLLIWDAFRPTASQWNLWEVFPDPVYVANPEKGYSSHSRGNTVDVTLVTLDGEKVEMPTEFDDFTSLADRDYSDVPEETAENAILLETIMRDCGFQPYSGEWWHFSDIDDYPVETSFIPD